MSFILLGILNSQAAAAGATNSYDLLETTIVSGSPSSVTFSNLNNYADYKHLQIRYVAKFNSSSSARWMSMRFNSDSGSNYGWHYLQGEGVGNVSGSAWNNYSYVVVGEPSGNNTSEVFTPGIVDVLDFSSTTKNKTMRSFWGLADNSISYWRVGVYSGHWRSTSAITSIQLQADNGSAFINGSRISIYGVK